MKKNSEEDHPNHGELDALLLTLSQGSLDEEERARLEAIIQSDDVARERYLDYMAVDAMLRFRAGSGVEELHRQGQTAVGDRFPART